MTRRLFPTPSVIALAAIAVAWCIFFIYPLWLSVKSGLIRDGQLSFYWIGRTLQNPLIARHLLNSFWISSWTLLGTIAVGMPLSLLLSRREFAGKSIWFALLMLPMILPPFVGALSIRRLLGRFGLLTLMLERIGALDISQTQPPDWSGGGMLAVVALQILHLFPIMTLNLTSSISAIDPSLLQAAAVFGGGRWRRFWRILLPLTRPGLFAGAALVFVWSYTDIGTPLVVGYHQTAAALVFKELARAELSGRTYGLVLVILSISLVCYTLGKMSIGVYAANASAKTATNVPLKRLGPIGATAAWLFFILLMGVAALPHLGVLATAFADSWVGALLPQRWTLAHFQFILTQPQTRQSIINSIAYAASATAAALAIGLLASWIIVRKKPTGWRALDMLLMSPIAVPGLILASGFLIMTRAGSFLESIGPLGNPFGILVIAYTVRRLPFVLRGLCAGLEQTPASLELAARNLGCPAGRAFLQVTLPLIAPHLLAATVLTFAFSMLEVSDSLMLAQLRQHYPLTKEIYSQAVSANPDAPQIASALGVLGMAVLGVSMALSGALMRKKMGQLFSSA